MIESDVKLLRLQHTDAKVYDGPFWASSLSARNALIWGGISANSLFFTSTTAVCVSVTSSQLKVLGSLSITGDSISAPQHLFQICNSGVDSLLMFTNDGRLGIGSGAGTIWDIAEDPTNLFVVKGGNTLFQDGNFKMKQLTETYVDFDPSLGRYNFYDQADSRPKVLVSPSEDYKLSVSGATKFQGGLDFVNNSDAISIVIDPNASNALSVTGAVKIDNGRFSIISGINTAVEYDQAFSKMIFYNNVPVPIIEIDPNSSFDRFSVTGNMYCRGDLNVDGSKNFKIQHPDPNKKNYNLIHSSLEGPEVGVYWRTRVKFYKDYLEVNVDLPDYWQYLIEKNSTQIFLTSKNNNVYVKNVWSNGFKLKRKKKFSKKEFVDCLVFGTRITEKKFILEELKER